MVYHPRMRVRALPALILALVAAALVSPSATPELGSAAARWVSSTLDGMTLDQKVGQLLMPSFRSTYFSNDSDRHDRLVSLVREQHVGGFLLFAGRSPAPNVLLGGGYPRGVPGQPLAAASINNRLQAESVLPLLNAADFETGVGFRIGGATTFPRAMAFGAAGDEALAAEAGRITALEARALGVHVNFAPVADVNNNPRNPVINTRSFGENPDVVSRLASAYVRGLQDGGMVATLKHFPGHGDTDVDSHLGLPLIPHLRERLDRIELPPFRAGIAAGAGAVMTSHIELPGLDPEPSRPATLSPPVVTGLLRDALGFDGLIYTDSMRMRAVTELASPGEAAVQAVVAGHDVVIHSPDDVVAFDALKAAAEDGTISEARLDRSVRRILEAKAALGLHGSRRVSLDQVPDVVGSRAHREVAAEVSRRGITLLKDERGSVPLRVPLDASVLYLSVVDYPTGWGHGAPSATFLPELRARWDDVTAMELSDRTTSGELAVVRANLDAYDAVVASVFVRTASYSGRMDLESRLRDLLRTVARRTEVRDVPFVTVFFGNPYAATFMPELPATLLTYDFYTLAETSAVRAITGEAPITGRLPIALGEYPIGHGLTRAAR